MSKKGQKFQTLKILTKRGKFLFFGLKAFQKCRNHKKILIFRYRYLMSKFLEKLLSKISIFSSKMKWHFKIWSFSKFLKIKMIFFIKSWVNIKNVILWCISCYCSSKKEKTGGEQKSYNCSFWAPSNFLDFWASPSWCTSRERIFYVN